jgi:hypothetical protein
MIVNFHLQGYCQLTSRYGRQVLGIPFRKFYDTMFDLIEQCAVLSPVKQKIRRSISDLLYSGKLGAGLNAHNLLFAESDTLYRRRAGIFDLAQQVLYRMTGREEPGVSEAQQLMILDMEKTYPVEIHAHFDLQDFSLTPRNWLVDKKYDLNLESGQNFEDQFYALRRKGLLKTTITRVNK